jgi:hypothetical protein
MSRRLTSRRLASPLLPPDIDPGPAEEAARASDRRTARALFALLAGIAAAVSMGFGALLGFAHQLP